MTKFLQIKTTGEYGNSVSGVKGVTRITAQAPAWTGRESRINYVKAVSQDDPQKTATSTITQLGSNIFKFAKNGLLTESGTVVFGGATYSTQITTNASSFTIEEEETPANTDKCVIVVKYNDTPIEAAGNSYTIPDDPGASGEVTVDIEITVPLNEDANSVSHVFTITSGEDSTEAVLTLTQAQATPTISLTPLTGEIAFSGGTVELTLTSNDEWTATVLETNE